MFIHIKLHGILAKRYGKFHKCVAANTTQALRYLDVNFSDFKSWVLAAQERGIMFKVATNGYEMDADELLDPLPEDFTISITPLFVATGGSGNLLKIIAGVALIGIGIFSGGAGFLGLSQMQLIITGSLLLLSGLMGGRTNKPEDETDARSFVFSGQTNSGSAGNRVMICYGRILVGSLVLSAAVRSYQTA